MRRWILSLGLIIGLILPAFGGVAAAAGHGRPSTAGQSQGKGSAFGQSVEQAVYAALGSGLKGTALANAVHVVIATLKPNAKGMAVAQAVYQSVYGVANGSEDITMPFTDMGGAGWASPSVNALSNAGVVHGTTGTTFAPNQKVTGAELLTMLSRLQAWQSTDGTGTGNVATGSQLLTRAPAFALQAIRAALAQGVVQGVGGLTDPSAPLTRAQAITLLVNSLGLSQAAQSQSGATLTLSGPVPSWARGAIALAIQMGLVQGSNGQIAADQTLTRGQMAVLLARMAMLEALATQGGLAMP